MTTERTRAGLQHVIPGCAPDWHGRVVALSEAPLRPTKPQAGCDVGLFADHQLDLVDLTRAAPTVPHRKDT